MKLKNVSMTTPAAHAASPPCEPVCRSFHEAKQNTQDM